MKAMEFIKHTVNTRVTPLAYLYALWEINFGRNQFFQDRKGGGSTVLSQIDALIPSEWWGLLLVVVSIILIIGMLFRHTLTVQASSFGGFVLWVMASISYGLSGFFWLHMTGGIIMALMFGYFFLAAGLDQLWDYSPERD